MPGAQGAPQAAPRACSLATHQPTRLPHDKPSSRQPTRCQQPASSSHDELGFAGRAASRTTRLLTSAHPSAQLCRDHIPTTQPAPSGLATTDFRAAAQRFTQLWRRRRIVARPARHACLVDLRLRSSPQRSSPHVPSRRLYPAYAPAAVRPFFAACPPAYAPAAVRPFLPPPTRRPEVPTLLCPQPFPSPTISRPPVPSPNARPRQPHVAPCTSVVEDPALCSCAAALPSRRADEQTAHHALARLLHSMDQQHAPASAVALAPAHWPATPRRASPCRRAATTRSRST